MVNNEMERKPEGERRSSGYWILGRVKRADPGSRKTCGTFCHVRRMRHLLCVKCSKSKIVFSYGITPSADTRFRNNIRSRVHTQHCTKNKTHICTSTATRTTFHPFNYWNTIDVLRVRAGKYGYDTQMIHKRTFSDPLTTNAVTKTFVCNHSLSFVKFFFTFCRLAFLHHYFAHHTNPYHAISILYLSLMSPAFRWIGFRSCVWRRFGYVLRSFFVRKKTTFLGVCTQSRVCVAIDRRREGWKIFFQLPSHGWTSPPKPFKVLNI